MDDLSEFEYDACAAVTDAICRIGEDAGGVVIVDPTPRVDGDGEVVDAGATSGACEDGAIEVERVAGAAGADAICRVGEDAGDAVVVDPISEVNGDVADVGATSGVGEDGDVEVERVASAAGVDAIS